MSAPTLAPALQLRGVAVHYGGVHAVDGVDFDIAEGQLVGLVGPNGSGKTTLLNAISGLTHLTAGSISALGADLSHRPPEVIARSGIRRTFQSIRLLPDVDVLENVMLGADDGRTVLQPLFAPWRARAGQKRSRAAALEALDRVGMADFARTTPGALPYGHQRRVEIARALAASPRILLLDEPVAGMSSSERDEIAQLLVQLRGEGLTQVLIEHDLGLVTTICDPLIVMDFGKVLAMGDPSHVTSDKLVREAYLGHGRANSAH